MKRRHVIVIIAVLLMVLTACKQSEDSNVVDNLPVVSGAAVAEITEVSDGAESDNIENIGEVDETEEKTAEIVSEEGVTVESGDGEDSTEEQTGAGAAIHEIVIENFQGNPADLSINAGDTVKWTNNMVNFKQIIIILPYIEDEGKYSQRQINEVTGIVKGESYEYVFEEAGKYKWGSKSNFEKIKGIITVS